MTLIANRTDVSDWLIHFVRDRDPDTDFQCEEWAYDALVGDIEPDAPAVSVLGRIVRLGGLLPGFSYRPVGKTAGVKTTIYGGHPVVCFTEAPLDAFAQYVRDRGRHTRCAPYGVCLLKREVFAAGGRPVIYGLSGPGTPPLTEDTQQSRLIDPAVLPLAEQFRYVAYDPRRGKPLDWTHEREWRWRSVERERHSLWYEGPGGAGFYPGLRLFTGESDGGFFSRVGLIVQTRSEADELAATLLTYRDVGCNNYATPYARDVLERTFVIPIDEALKAGSKRIEDLAPTFRVVASRPMASPDLVIKVQTAVAKARHVSQAAAAAFLEKHRSKKDGIVHDVCGGADVVIYDSISPVTSALLDASLAHGSGAEYYVVDAIGELAGDQALSYRSAAAEAACEYLNSELGDLFAVKSWWD